MRLPSRILAGYLPLLLPCLQAFASPLASPQALTAPRPPKRPVCPPDLGPRPPPTRWFQKNCEDAIAKIPRDPRLTSVERNFYVRYEDMSRTMPNVLLPMEWEAGDCMIQLLLASSFRDIPHDRATWMDVWGPARQIWQQCIASQSAGVKAGGIVTNIGLNEKLDLVIYSKRSRYALTRRLQNSRDPVAEDIADYEFLQLLGLVPWSVHGEEDMGARNGTDAVATA